MVALFSYRAEIVNPSERPSDDSASQWSPSGIVLECWSIKWTKGMSGNKHFVCEREL